MLNRGSKEPAWLMKPTSPIRMPFEQWVLLDFDGPGASGSGNHNGYPLHCGSNNLAYCWAIQESS